jgi:hypothetical protein
MIRSIHVLFWLVGLSRQVLAQTKSSPIPPRPNETHLDLAIERSENGTWRPLSPQTVLDNGNEIRFRLRTSFPGYLYAYYRSSDGDAEWLYPSPGSDQSNRIEGGTDYAVPAGSTFYVVRGKPGFDLIYWLISPAPFPALNWRPRIDDGPVPRTMVPRCREYVRVGQACMDDHAGAAQIAKASELIPHSEASPPSTLKPRELRLTSEAEGTRIESKNGPGLIVYEFRVAHR